MSKSTASKTSQNPNAASAVHRGQTRTKTQVVVRTRAEFDVAIRTAGLDAEEEKVLRMRYGIGLDAAAVLEQRGQDSEESRQTLAQIEQRAVAGVQAQAAVDAPRRAAIIERLRRM